MSGLGDKPVHQFLFQPMDKHSVDLEKTPPNLHLRGKTEKGEGGKSQLYL